MQKPRLTGFYNVLIQDFNLCFFTALFILSLYSSRNRPLYFDHGWFLYFLIPSINALLNSLIILALNRYLFQKGYTKKYHTSYTTSLFAVAFLAGFLSVYITLFDWSTYLISTAIIYISAVNIRIFFGKISELLQPDTMATPNDLSEFANFFINLIITFAVVNLSVNTIHQNFNAPDAFNFGSGIDAIINALYFSIITMTTVGYGHLIPQTAIAKMIVGVECLTGYLLLGLMIGIITRGIKINKEQ